MDTESINIAIATGNSLMNEEIEKNLPDEKIMVVHFKEFLMEKEFETIILSNKLRGDVELEALLHNLKKQGKRVIFLTDIKNREEIDLCIKYGIHDILYQHITIGQVLDLLKTPNTVADVSHLISDTKSTDVKIKDESEGTVPGKGGGKWLDLFSRSKKEKTEEEQTDAPSNEPEKRHTTSEILIEDTISKENAEDQTMIQDSNTLIVESTDLFDDTEPELEPVGEQVETVIKERMEALKAPVQKASIKTEFNETEPKKLSHMKPVKVSDIIRKKVIPAPTEVKSTDNEKHRVSRKLKISNLRVAVTGQHSNIGTTHTSLLVAYSILALGAKKIAIVQAGDNNDFEEIFDYFASIKNKTLKLKGAELFKTEQEIIPRINEFDAIVFDVGQFKRSHMKSIFRMANLKIIVAEGNPYKRRGLLGFIKDFGSEHSDAYFALPHATALQVKEFNTFMETKHSFSVPSNKVFYEPRDVTIKTIEKLIRRKVKQ